MRALSRDSSGSSSGGDPRAPGIFHDPGAEESLLLEAAGLLAVEEPLVDPVELGAGLEELRGDGAARKRGGSYYTGAELARTTVRRTLDSCGVGEPRICDPACGGGAFLVQALRLLREAGTTAPERLVYGIDVDPLAVDCARAALWLELGDPEAPVDLFHHGLRCGDALVGIDPEEAFSFPAACLDRRAGDGDHPGPGHLPGSWEEELKLHRGRLRGLRWPGAARGWDPRLRADLWCALWFWPPDLLGLLPAPWPEGEVPAALVETARKLAREERFFHLPLEWPEVSRSGGFDAVVGNPPWEQERPDSRQWFEEHDPGYRGRKKQEALAVQRDLFGREPELERAWLLHGCRHRGRAHWFRERSASGGERNLYALFLERGLDLLREGGALGMLVPAGLAGDRGTRGLRERLLDRCSWEWLFSFENSEGLFDIHRSYSFCAVVARRGGETRSVRAAFGRTRAAEWEEAESLAMDYPRALVRRTSPINGGLVPFRTARDRELYERLHGEGQPLFESDWGVEYRREVDLTLQSRHFRTADELPPGGRLDSRGAWLVGDWSTGSGPRSAAPEGAHEAADGPGWCDPSSVTSVHLPLYQGSMVQQYDHRAKGWDGEAWSAAAAPRPRYWIPEELYKQRRSRRGPKLVLRDVARATDARSLIVALVPDLPCGNVLPVLESDAPLHLLLAVLDSFVVDWACRQRLVGAHLNRFFLEELSVLPLSRAEEDPLLGELAWQLVPAHPDLPEARGEKQPGQRRRIRAELEARIARLYGLGQEELAWILRDCGHERVGRSLSGADPRGFWRVDRDLTPGERSTNLTLLAHGRLARSPQGASSG